MRILFIYPDISVHSGRFQQGIGSISSVLKKNGHKVSLLHLEKEMSKKKILTEVESLSPDLVAFSCTTNQYPYVELCSKWIKEMFKIPIICGGVHPTLSPEGVISDENIDMICIGEGEYPMLELANRLETGEDPTSIKNLWVKAEGKLYKNSLRPLIANLDELPFPDRDLFNYAAIIEKLSHKPNHPRIAEIMTGRGCPFNCTYCCNHALRRAYEDCGSYIRRRSVENVLDEIEYLTKRYKINRLYFDDDTFTMNPRWLEDFCDKYSQRFSLPFSCNAFPTTLNENLVYQLKNAGCERIAVGIESGNEWLRRTVLRREVTNEQIIETFKLVNKAGIQSYSFNIIGLPFETPEMVEDTIKLNSQLAVDVIQVSVFYPYPKTDLYEICRQNGWLSQNEKISYFGESTTLNLPTLTKEQIAYYYRKMRSLSIANMVRSTSPKAYVAYKLTKRLLGESLTDKTAVLAAKLLYRADV